MKMLSFLIKSPLLIGFTLILGACTTTEIDQFRQTDTEINGDDSIVILGRRQSNAYETEGDFVECVGNVVASGSDGINVIPEELFLNEMFPFFEPRTAPMRTDHLEQLMQQETAAQKLDEFGVVYIVWLDGLTQRSGENGSISCAVGPGGGGCFGFGTWVDDSNFEAEIWDMNTLTSAGAISADANGQSYLPAIIVPIPLLARVESNACSGMGQQLKSFLNGSV
tara:strand:+ start:96527 stop:97198 length:672 start_codon:yes stop_codon:yes gene_type:complete